MCTLEYYGAFAEFISAIESYHEDIHDGVTIDCCNSLIQSISKTIITQLTTQSVTELDGRQYNKTSKLIKEAAALLQKNDDLHELNFVKQISSLGESIYELRRARGTISHGRSIPTSLVNDQDLSRLLIEITESLARYLLSSFFSHALEKQEDEFDSEEELIDYTANSEFNDELDKEYPYEGKLLYSQALYTLYYSDYKDQLQDFLEGKELDEQEELITAE